MKLPQGTYPTSAFGRIQICNWPFVIIINTVWKEVKLQGLLEYIYASL